MLRFVSASTMIIAAAAAALAADAPIPSAEHAAMLAQFKEQTAVLSRAIEKSPREISLYSRRGDCHLFLGNFAAAVLDFEKMIALDSAQDAPHWRLGIAYHFTGQFAKSAKQFEKYHPYDGRDRENGIWKFLADVRVLGLEPARRAMLAYTRFDREPFPALYEMFGGTKSTSEFFADLTSRKLEDDMKVMFFANYYAGLHEMILGRHDQALTFLRAAVANPWGRTAEGGPAYMWQVARLHYEMHASAKRSPSN
jgi:lipoprotein NlpI